MRGLVSILIPCYNAEKWVKQAIESALSQTWPNKEIIFVDDGSTDNSLAIAKEYESTLVKIVSQKNEGACVARNKALEYAKGNYIQWLDADDILSPKKIEFQMTEAHLLSNSGILLSSPWGEFFYRHYKRKFVRTNLWQDLDPVEWFLIKFSEAVYMTNTSWLVSRELTEAAGPWDERLSRDQDGEYFCRVVASCEKVVFVPEALSYYRRGSPKSVSVNPSFEARESAFLSRMLCINYLRAMEYSDRTRRASLMFLQNGLRYYYLKQSPIMQRAQELAEELGGELSPPVSKWRLRLARAILGRDLAEKTRRLTWVLKTWIAANWDHLFYSFSKK